MQYFEGGTLKRTRYYFGSYEKEVAIDSTIKEIDHIYLPDGEVAVAEKIGLVSNSIRNLLAGKALTTNSFKFFSPEHNQHFEAKDIRLKIENEQDNPDKLRLTLNRKDIADWFKQMYNNQRHIIRPYNKPEINNGKGFKV